MRYYFPCLNRKTTRCDPRLSTVTMKAYLNMRLNYRYRYSLFMPKCLTVYKHSGSCYIICPSLKRLLKIMQYFRSYGTCFNCRRHVGEKYIDVGLPIMLFAPFVVVVVCAVLTTATLIKLRWKRGEI